MVVFLMGQDDLWGAVPSRADVCRQPPDPMLRLRSFFLRIILRLVIGKISRFEEGSGLTEVADADAALAVDKQVAWLDVSVH